MSGYRTTLNMVKVAGDDEFLWYKAQC
jgi:hypothetical protein